MDSFTDKNYGFIHNDDLNPNDNTPSTSFNNSEIILNNTIPNRDEYNSLSTSYMDTFTEKNYGLIHDDDLNPNDITPSTYFNNSETLHNNTIPDNDEYKSFSLSYIHSLTEKIMDLSMMMT